MPTNGSTTRSPWRTSKCTWGKLVSPDSPTSASGCPASTRSPCLTIRLPRRRWQYQVVQPSPWARRMPLPHSLPSTACRPASFKLTSGMPSRKRVDHARSRRAHLDARRHGREVADRDVGALVAVAGEPAAHEVAHAGARLVVDIAQHPAVRTRRAIDRQGKMVRRLRGGRFGQHERDQHGQQSTHGCLAH